MDCESAMLTRCRILKTFFFGVRFELIPMGRIISGHRHIKKRLTQARVSCGRLLYRSSRKSWNAFPPQAMAILDETPKAPRVTVSAKRLRHRPARSHLRPDLLWAGPAHRPAYPDLRYRSDRGRCGLRMARAHPGRGAADRTLRDRLFRLRSLHDLQRPSAGHDRNGGQGTGADDALLACSSLRWRSFWMTAAALRPFLRSCSSRSGHWPCHNAAHHVSAGSFAGWKTLGDQKLTHSVIVLIMAVVTISPLRPRRWWWIALLVAAIVMLFLSGERKGWVAAALAVFMALVISDQGGIGRRAVRRTLGVALSAAGLIAIASILAPFRALSREAALQLDGFRDPAAF